MTKHTLPARLIAHAECHESQPELMSDPEQRQWAADLREAAGLLEWIPVSARLPLESDRTVAVLLDNGEPAVAWATYWHGASSAFAEWTFPDGNPDGYSVTHWMPLPTAPTKAEALRPDIEALKSAIAGLPGLQHWFVVGAPWGNGDFVVAGHPDPHLGSYVCDTEDFDGEKPHALEYAAYIAAANPAVVNRLLHDVEAVLAKVRAEQERVRRLHQRCEELEAALRGLMVGCRFFAIGNEAPHWHEKAMPSTAALEAARAALSSRTQEQT